MRKISDMADLVDSYLYLLICGLLLFVMSIQAGLVLHPALGLKLNHALRLEGETLEPEELTRLADGIAAMPWASLRLTLLDFVSLPEVMVMVDGQERGTFIKDELTLNVKHGNIITIYNPYPYDITVEISKATPNVSQPALQSRVSGQGRLYFAPVIVRQGEQPAAPD